MDDFNYSEENKDTPKFEGDLYKKWTKVKGTSRFLTLRPWLAGGKISVDIGESTEAGHSNTKVWASSIGLATYLKAVKDGTALNIYPNEEYVYYGGGQMDGSPVSRVLKVSYWKQGENTDTSGFAFKAGHFKGRQSDTGAFIPIMSEPLSVSMIKVTRAEIAEISYLIDLSMVNHAAQEPYSTWVDQVNGRKK